MKEELGLDHFEGRSWHGLHHHALMVMIALASLQYLRLAEHRRRTGPGKNAAPRSGAAAIAEPARRAPRHHRAAVRLPRLPRPMSALQTQVQTTWSTNAQVVLDVWSRSIVGTRSGWRS